MTHSEMDEVYELYLLGVLETEQAAEIASHLARGCSYCEANLQQASEVVGSLSNLVEVKPPAPALRKRVLAMVEPVRPKRQFAWPVAFALACAASVVLIFGLVSQQNKSVELLRERNELRGALAILSQGDTKTVSFGQAQNEPQGRVFISRNGGVVFIGNRLPGLAVGKIFEFWLVPGKGNPEPAGLFTRNAQGVSVNVLPRAINPAAYAAVAVSIEPDGGSPTGQPTSKPILIVPLG